MDVSACALSRIASICAGMLLAVFCATPSSAAPTSYQPMSDSALSKTAPTAYSATEARALESMFQEAMKSPTAVKLPERAISVDTLMRMTLAVSADVGVPGLPSWIKNITSSVAQCNPDQHLGPDSDPKNKWGLIDIGSGSQAELEKKIRDCVKLCEEKSKYRYERTQDKPSCNVTDSEEQIFEKLKWWREFLKAEEAYWSACFNVQNAPSIIGQTAYDGDHKQKYLDSMGALKACQRIFGKKFEHLLKKSGMWGELRDLYPEVYAYLYPDEAIQRPPLSGPIVQPVRVGSGGAGDIDPGKFWLLCTPEPIKRPAAGGGGTVGTAIKCVLRRAGGAFFMVVPMQFLPGYVPPTNDPYNPPNAF